MILSVILALIVTGIVGVLIFKKYKSQSVLFLAGFVLMAFAIIFNTGEILEADASTGSAWMDIFEFVSITFSSSAAKTGMIIMSVTGFAKYMDKIGASKLLVKLCIKPLKKMNAPYLTLALCFMLGQLLRLVIPSASGLGMLLMVTIYPLLISVGVSKLSATAAIATTSCLDLGPASASTAVAAEAVNMTAPQFFTTYQLPVAICVMISVAITHLFVQKWFDKRENHVAEGMNNFKMDDEVSPPLIYAFLPFVPFVILMLFGFLQVGGIEVDVVPAMFFSLFVAMVCECIRTRNIKEVFKSIQVYFDGMGKQFASVITLIVAGQVFAQGLISLGTIDYLIEAAQNASAGGMLMIIIMSLIIVFCTIIMGSGTAPFFSFAAFGPQIAESLGMNAAQFVLPMQLSSSIARPASPITAVVVAVCGVSDVSPFDVIKRTAIPMAVAWVVMQISSFVMFQFFM